VRNTKRAADQLRYQLELARPFGLPPASRTLLAKRPLFLQETEKQGKGAFFTSS